MASHANTLFFSVWSFGCEPSKLMGKWLSLDGAALHVSRLTYCPQSLGFWFCGKRGQKVVVCRRHAIMSFMHIHAQTEMSHKAHTQSRRARIFPLQRTDWNQQDDILNVTDLRQHMEGWRANGRSWEETRGEEEDEDNRVTWPSACGYWIDRVSRRRELFPSWVWLTLTIDRLPSRNQKA